MPLERALLNTPTTGITQGTQHQSLTTHQTLHSLNKRITASHQHNNTNTCSLDNTQTKKNHSIWITEQQTNWTLTCGITTLTTRTQLQTGINTTQHNNQQLQRTTPQCQTITTTHPPLTQWNHNTQQSSDITEPITSPTTTTHTDNDTTLTTHTDPPALQQTITTTSKQTTTLNCNYLTNTHDMSECCITYIWLIVSCSVWWLAMLN